MYIFKNALVSISRNKGRNILIGIIVIVIACTTAVTLAIKTSANNLIESYQNKYDIKASIGVNRENMMSGMKPVEDMSEDDITSKRDEMIENFNEVSNISVDDIINYGTSDYVKEYYYSMSVGVNSESIEKVSSTTSEESANNKDFGRMPNGKENFMNMSNSDFTLIGYSSTYSMEDFINGQYSITDGVIFDIDSENSCVINSELATINDIEVGGSIKLVDASDEDNIIKLTVTGIFEEKSISDEIMGMFTSSANTVITSANVVNKLSQENEDMKVTTTPTFVLNSKDDIESFESELTEKGLSEYLSVTTNLETVENSTKTISNVSNFATTFLIITLIIGGIVLFVINMINIRERKYEIGVLRTIGMKKSLLSLQFISELLIVSIVALLLGAGIGSAVSVPVSNSLLESEIESSKQEVEQIGNNFGGKNFSETGRPSGVVNISEINSIDAAVNMKVLFELLGIGILLTLISSTASMISIQKFSPLSILKERT